MKINFRGDSGFCRWRMLRWCEQNNIDYIVGLARNARTKAQSEALLALAAGWDRPRAIVTKVEHTARQARTSVTS